MHSLICGLNLHYSCVTDIHEKITRTVLENCIMANSLPMNTSILKYVLIHTKVEIGKWKAI